MVTPVEESIDLELTGEGYNVMLQKPDKFGNFKVDLVLSGDQLDKALEFQDKYGMKVKSTLKYPTSEGLKEESKKHVTLRAKFSDTGDIIRKFVPTKDDEGNVVRDMISHGAKMTVRFRVYSYRAGDNYPAGNGFQLNGVRVHEYEPFNKVA